MIKRRIRLFFLAIILLIVALGLIEFGSRLAPTPSGPEFYTRLESTQSMETTLKDLQNQNVVRDADAMRLYAILTRRPTRILAGTYRVHTGLTANQLMARLENPIVLKVRIPETNWAKRTASLLETKYEICSASDYMSLIHDPAQFADEVTFPLPKDSLEGYLYPDTYELEPMSGAKGVIVRQLKAFQTKIWDAFSHPTNLDRVVKVASMVQLESGPSTDKPKIAGVIENRLAQHMRLQIDASLLYGIQKWRRLTYADYKNLKTPYNTYLHQGLPPGPICSPDASSVDAALHPDRAGKKVFYVALPDGRTVFAATYREHLLNVKLRKLELKALGK